MAIAFRVDSSFNIGSGHIYRCMSLAAQLRFHLLREQKTSDIYFISKKAPGNFIHLITQAGFKTITLEQQLTEEEDAVETLKILHHYQVSKLIVDHYELSLTFESKVKKSNIKLIAIDDLMNRVHDCDILIDQNYKENYTSCYKDLVPKNCKLFLGPRYSLLREEFYTQQSQLKIYPIKEIKQVLVFFGSSDPDGETLRFIEETKDLNHSFHFHIMLSSGNKFYEDIKNFLNPNYTLHIDSKEVSKLMSQCDFYFGSGGSITWERMCLGLNGAIVLIAENQRLVAEELGKSKLQYYWGWANKFHYANLIPELERINKYDLELINLQRIKGMQLIDKESLLVLLKEILN